MPNEKKQFSPIRRMARVLVWTAFACLLVYRFAIFKPEPQMRGPRGGDWEERRFRRPAAFTPAPVNEVPNTLPRIHIQIAPKDVEILRGYYWTGRRGQQEMERPDVTATVREGTTVYTNVSLHLKGAAGSFRPFDDKPALTLNFSKHAKGQLFRGYSKLSLNNSVQDPTYLCEAISRELFDRAGVPVPKAEFATVLINGRDLGLYVMVEGYNKQFLRRYFSNVNGNLYDGGFCREVSPNLDVNSGEHPEDRSDIERLLTAAMEQDPFKRWERLNTILDTHRFITMLAMEVMTCHWDGYGLNRNNYRLFHDLETDRMVFMPHGLDQMFDYPPDRRFPAEGSIQPNMRGIIARAALGTPQGAQLYFERVRALHEELFKEEMILGRVRELGARLRPTLAAYSPSIAEWHDEAVASLCSRISRRIRSIGEQLKTPREPLPFDQSGAVLLRNWNERFPSDNSFYHMEQVQMDGQNLLQIDTPRGGTCSWRTRVLLGSGQYRFEGRAKVNEEGVGSRVSLRISGSAPLSREVAIHTDWIPLEYSFSVDGLVSEVVLVCEFSGSRGKAWFDLDSLRLVRQ